MKIVVTGALGHIGSALIRYIPTKCAGAEILIIDNLLTQRYCSLFHLPSEARYRFVEGDVLTIDLRALFTGADAVIQLAAITDATRSFENKEMVEYNNYTTTARIADACGDVGCPLVHLSSTSVYGSQREVVDEECGREELRPQSPYAATKLKEESLLQSLAAEGKLRFLTYRFGTICGTSPGMRFHTAVNKFCWQAILGQPITVWRTALKQKRPYLALDDAIAAIMFALERDLFNCCVYNVVTSNLTVESILNFIRRHVPQLNIQFVDTEIMNQLSYEVSNRRFLDEGFRFGGSIERSIADTMQLLGRAGGKSGE